MEHIPQIFVVHIVHQHRTGGPLSWPLSVSFQFRALGKEFQAGSTTFILPVKKKVEQVIWTAINEDDIDR